jgi:hypothetical protein
MELNVEFHELFESGVCLLLSLDCVLFTCVAGSPAYGTHKIDEDIRGVYAVRADR